MALAQSKTTARRQTGRSETERGKNMVSNFSGWPQASRDAREGGQALVEYTLLLMFVALVAVTALQTIGVNILGPLTEVATGVGGA